MGGCIAGIAYRIWRLNNSATSEPRLELALARPETDPNECGADGRALSISGHAEAFMVRNASELAAACKFSMPVSRGA